jgi:hypothetical protein
MYLAHMLLLYASLLICVLVGKAQPKLKLEIMG